MNAIAAQGTCACGTFSKSYGADERDATLLLNHHHGHDNGHPFNGEITLKEAQYPSLVTKGIPDGVRRRK
jgi:hypothetical protein